MTRNRLILGSIALAAGMCLAGCSTQGGFFSSHSNDSALTRHANATETQFFNQLQGEGAQVKQQGNEVTVVLPSDTNFHSNSATISNNFKQQLQTVAQVLKADNSTRAEIQGNTDSSGSERLNQALSTQRANAVAQFLEAQGIDSSRLHTVGLSSNNPVASNDTTDGRAQNRRVEISFHFNKTNSNQTSTDTQNSTDQDAGTTTSNTAANTTTDLS